MLTVKIGKQEGEMQPFCWNANLSSVMIYKTCFTLNGMPAQLSSNSRPVFTNNLKFLVFFPPNIHHLCNFFQKQCLWTTLSPVLSGLYLEQLEALSLKYHWSLPTKLQEVNVFIRVCLSVHRGGFPCDHYPSCIRPHCTGPPDPSPWILDIGPLTPY